jgi:hypothetical protein
MAGGVFPGKPFEFNVKCIIFSLILSLGYWFSPRRNLWVLAFLLWFPYLAMAWYDWSYKCESKLQPTAVPFGRYIWLPFKPDGYKQAFNDLPPEKIAIMDRVDHLTGWTLVAAAATWYLLKNKRG